MKIIVAGSRVCTTRNDYEKVKNELNKMTITEIVSGGAVGADRLGEFYAQENNIKITRFLPDWSVGRSAGPIRNRTMALYGDMLIVIWDGHSRGSQSMIRCANEQNLQIIEIIPDRFKMNLELF